MRAAIVALEPAFAPKPDHPGIARLSRAPHLHVGGDSLDTTPVWIELGAEVRGQHAALKAAGVMSGWLELPAEGLKGNAHVLMMAANPDAIAAMILAWLRKLERSGRVKTQSPDSLDRADRPVEQAGPWSHQKSRPRSAVEGR
jgi:hypothetical protein